MVTINEKNMLNWLVFFKEILPDDSGWHKPIDELIRIRYPEYKFVKRCKKPNRVRRKRKK